MLFQRYDQARFPGYDDGPDSNEARKARTVSRSWLGAGEGEQHHRTWSTDSLRGCRRWWHNNCFVNVYSRAMRTGPVCRSGSSLCPVSSCFAASERRSSASGRSTEGGFRESSSMRGGPGRRRAPQGIPSGVMTTGPCSESALVFDRIYTIVIMRFIAPDANERTRFFWIFFSRVCFSDPDGCENPQDLPQDLQHGIVHSVKIGCIFHQSHASCINGTACA